MNEWQLAIGCHLPDHWLRDIRLGSRIPGMSIARSWARSSYYFYTTYFRKIYAPMPGNTGGKGRNSGICRIAGGSYAELLILFFWL
jgi:hypothetical protein